MADFGPFSVDPSQVAGLTGADFADFTGRLLDAERARAGLDGASLTMTYRTNAGDGGVDADLRRAVATAWIPAGESAWQFKAGDLGPESCKAELRGATAALAILRAGGSYRLVLGKSITPEQITERREALESVAEEVGIHVSPGQFEVLNGDSMARWAEEFPAVASSPTIRGMGIIGQTFDEWSNSVVHRTAWVESEERSEQIAALRDAIREGDELGVHVEGVSGLGKTRLVMETLRGQDNQALVVYVPSEDQFEPAVLSRLHQQGRAAVVVIDECDPKRHDVFSAMLQAGTRIRLVTISEPTTVSTRAPVVLLKPFADQPLTQLLLGNEPALWPEAARVIVEVSSGNIDYALKCAKALIAQRSASARQLVTPEDIRQFIADELPDGALFLASCALALFSRVGFDGDLAVELELLARGLSIPEADLRSAAAVLTNSGLLNAQGRYRSVGPHPVSIHLASRGWMEFGSQILTDLMPLLSEDLVERLFARATEIGDRALPMAVVDQLLGAGGPLGSLESVAEDRRGGMLGHLAVLSPERVVSAIEDLLADSTDLQLQQAAGARRPLVWALQKLVWHTATFEQAADAMLRLATVENESYANNSTGEWVSLFGTNLPSTAASPSARAAYLQNKAASTDVRVRENVVEAAKRALSTNEWTLISGEVQGGVIVEPRGRPATWGEAWLYQKEMIDVLRALADDPEPGIADAALQALIESIHSCLEHESVRRHLAGALSTLDSDRLRGIRAKLASLSTLYDRTEEDAGQQASIAEVLGSLPPETARDRLWLVLHSQPWGRTSADIEADVLNPLIEMAGVDPAQVLIDSLDEPIPNDFIVGRLLARTPSGSIEEVLVAQLSGPNSRALLGYLLGREDAEEGAFDRFIDNLEAADDLKLQLTTQGPHSARASERISELLPLLTVATGARGVFYWAHGLPDEELLSNYLDGWLARLETQDDYNAIVDFLVLQLHQRVEVSAALEGVIGDVVARRVSFPAVGAQEYDWKVLAARVVEERPGELAALLIDLVDTDSIRMYSDSTVSELLRRAVELAGPATWQEVMQRIAQPGSFRLAFGARGWLAEAVDIDVAASWVGASQERAQVLASVASVGGEQLSPVVRLLINEFGESDRVSSILEGHFVSGMWTGNESARITRQIAQARGWLLDPTATQPEKRWSRRLVERLEARLVRVLQEEQEEA